MLAEILLKHTDNVDSAKEHLDTALNLSKNLAHEPELILHILYFSSIAHEQKRQYKALKQYLKRGTEFIEYEFFF